MAQPSYLSAINFFFEGKVVLMAQYTSVNDPNKTKNGWSHGSDYTEVQTGNWTPQSSSSVITAPVAYFDNKTGTLTAFSFKELLYSYSTTVPKV